MAENEQTKKSGISFIIIILAIIIIAAGAGYFYFTRKEQIIYDEPIKYDKVFPYIFSQKFNSSLQNYINNKTYNQYLLVYGASNSGKTRGINEFGKMLAANGSLVLNFDFLEIGQYSTPKDIISIISETFINSFRSISKGSYSFRSVKPLLDEFLLSAHAKSVNVKPRLANKELNEILSAILGVVNTISGNSHITYKALFYILNLISPIIEPVVIIHNIENLRKVQSASERLSVFWEESHEFLDFNLSFPVIFEISDQSSLIDHTIPLEHDLFTLVDIPPFNQEEAKQILVEKENIFTPENFASLWDEFGSCGECYDFAYQLLSQGLSLANTILEIKSRKKEIILRALTSLQNQTLADERNEYLKKLARKPITVVEDPEAAAFFTRNKVATIKNLTKSANVKCNDNLIASYLGTKSEAPSANPKN
ncbi:hypothetical protein GPJ56_002950 [Histomonas meleagridis]|uniref:uncharacterized protein n=1 Tax=Histomonas meleagridis TaxID=135588 RepID=UPI0035597DEE|nr:hypothetical protein GPJ56_002950 [Histomonas meleagridis]KAH0796609.1 hypothetical protein GO595_010502 [Histomonas meleagridis]